MAKNNKAPTAPSWLDEIATKEWKRMAKLLVEDAHDFNEKDYKALEAYCSAYSDFQRTAIFLKENGYTFSTPNGYIQQRPEVAIYKSAQQELRSWTKELGLTAGARARIFKNIADGGGSNDDEMEDMIVK